MKVFTTLQYAGFSHDISKIYSNFWVWKYDNMVRLIILKIFHPIMLSKQTSSKLTFSYFLLYKRGRVKNYKHVWVSQQYALICTTCTIVHSHQLFLVSVRLTKVCEKHTAKIEPNVDILSNKSYVQFTKICVKKIEIYVWVFIGILKFMSEFLIVFLKFEAKSWEFAKNINFFEKWKVSTIFEAEWFLNLFLEVYQIRKIKIQAG